MNKVLGEVLKLSDLKVTCYNNSKSEITIGFELKFE